MKRRMAQASKTDQRSGLIKLLSIGFVLCLSGLPLASAQAQIADSACDPQYYDSLESRAWLEAQREITQNQNLIFKPDSVFEYTCFDQSMGVLATQAANMFSESSRWGSILGQSSMDTALRNLVGNALQNYIRMNYANGSDAPYPLLGWRASGSTPVQGVINSRPFAATASYACDVMNRIWMRAKCMDFVDNPQEDGFFSFAEYAGSPDKRFLPSRCSAPVPWQDNINLSFVTDNTPWAEDTVTTYLGQMDPANCSSHTPIPTGIVVSRSGTQPLFYNEKICIAPGCHYVPSGNGTSQSPSDSGSCQAS